MKRKIKFSHPLQAIAAASAVLYLMLLAACATPSDDPRAEFIRSVNFTHYDVYYLEQPNVRRLDLRSGTRDQLAESTQAALQSAFNERGFEQAAQRGEGHFLVTAIWSERDLATSAPQIRTPSSAEANLAEEMRTDRRQDLTYALTVEIADANTGHVFWRSRPDPRTQTRSISDSAVEAAVSAAVRNFPERIVTDPSLPSIQ